eukprot:4863207-Pleurochrysis_carterae.AAC.1
MAGKPAASLVSLMPGAKAAKLNNAGGGHYNHCMFWNIMGPKAGGAPTGTLAEKIDAAFGSYDDFKSAFSTAAAGARTPPDTYTHRQTRTRTTLDTPAQTRTRTIMDTHGYAHARHVPRRQAHARAQAAVSAARVSNTRVQMHSRSPFTRCFAVTRTRGEEGRGRKERSSERSFVSCAIPNYVHPWCCPFPASGLHAERLELLGSARFLTLLWQRHAPMRSRQTCRLQAGRVAAACRIIVAPRVHLLHL